MGERDDKSSARVLSGVILWIVLVFTITIPLWAMYLLWALILLSLLWWLMAIFKVGRWCGGGGRYSVSPLLGASPLSGPRELRFLALCW